MINWFIEVVSECFLICIYSSETEMWLEVQMESIHSLLLGLLILNPPLICWYYYDCLVYLSLLGHLQIGLLTHPTSSLVHTGIISLWSLLYFLSNFEFRSAQFVKMSKWTWPSTVGIVWVLLKVISCFFSLPHQIGIAIILSNNFFLADLWSVWKSVAQMPYMPRTYQASSQAVYVIECCQRTKST